MSENRRLVLSQVDLIHTSKKQWIGFSIVFLICWSISLFLWFQVDIDKRILFALNNSNFGDTLIAINRFFTRYGMSVIVFIYMLYLVLSHKFPGLRKSRQVFLLIIFSFAVAGITGDILKEIFNRVRPFEVYANDLTFLSRPGSPSMPSGHATKITALAIPFLFYTRYKGCFHIVVKCILILVAATGCFSRIFLGAHYPSDVVAGIGWAFICLPLAAVLSNLILRRMSLQRFELAAKIWILVYLAFMIYLILA